MYLGDIHAEMRAEAGDAQERYADEYYTPQEVKDKVKQLESQGYSCDYHKDSSDRWGETWVVQYIKEWQDEDGEWQSDEGEVEVEVDTDFDEDDYYDDYY